MIKGFEIWKFEPSNLFRILHFDIRIFAKLTGSLE